MSNFKPQDLISAVTQIPNGVIHQNGSRRKPRRLVTDNSPVVRLGSVLSAGEIDGNVGCPGKPGFPVLVPPEDESELWDVLQKADEYGDIWGEIEEEGVDAIAWYRSFHKFHDWGIYIPISGVLYLANQYSRSGLRPMLAVSAAWECLLRHELVHYGVDVAIGRLEVATNTPIYISSRNKMSRGGYVHEEEALANGAMLIAMKRFSIRARVLIGGGISPLTVAEQFMGMQPSGYRDGGKYNSKARFVAGSDEYLLQMHKTVGGSPFITTGSSSHLSGLYPIEESRGRLDQGYVDASECPIYIVEDVGSASSFGIYFISEICNIQESRRFAKQVGVFRPEWNKTKDKLANPQIPNNANSLDFKRWERGDIKETGETCWSVRVGPLSANMRAHLYFNPLTGEWLADDFGDADKMGHHKKNRR